MQQSLYERVGGQAFFDDLVTAFYDVVADDPILRPMYPEDLEDSIHWLALFLAQYWGGPQTYNQERGHPRLRLRHADFAITKAARDAWLRAMRTALDVMSPRLSEHDAKELDAYFAMSAFQLRNV